VSEPLLVCSNADFVPDILSKLRHVPTAGIDALDENGCMEGASAEIAEMDSRLNALSFG